MKDNKRFSCSGNLRHFHECRAIFFFTVRFIWWFGQGFRFFLVELKKEKNIPRHTNMLSRTRAHTNRKLPPSSNEFMQITNMQMRVVRLSCSVMRLEENTTKKKERKTHYESISFNLCRHRDSLIPTPTAFPPQCADSPHSATPFLPPLPSGVKTTGAGKCKPLGGKCSLTAFWCVCHWSVNNEGVSWNHSSCGWSSWTPAPDTDQGGRRSGGTAAKLHTKVRLSKA